MLGSTKTKIQIQKWGWIGGKQFFIDKNKLRVKWLPKERSENELLTFLRASKSLLEL